MSDDVRDVIARAVNAGINQHGFTVTKPIHKDRAYAHVSIEVIDAILAALHEAGYEVVKRGKPPCPECNGEGIVWPDSAHGPSGCWSCIGTGVFIPPISSPGETP